MVAERLRAGAAARLPQASARRRPAWRRDAFRAAVRRLDRLVLRGPRPAPGIDGLRARIARAMTIRRACGKAEAGTWRAARRRCRPRRRAAAWLDGWLAASPVRRRCAATACRRPARRPCRRRRGARRDRRTKPGAAAPVARRGRRGGRDLRRRAGRGGRATSRRSPGGAIPALLDALMAGRVVRPRFGRHPRLHIWGPLEARLQHADVVILGGLNEGTWPPEPPPDPWMSRPMRSALRPAAARAPHRPAAHDFAQAFCGAPRRADPRPAGRRHADRAVALAAAPRTLLAADGDRACCLRRPPDRRVAGARWMAGRTAIRAGRAARPAPAPPVERAAAPLSVTQIETWMRDPYAIYARHVLALEPLDPHRRRSRRGRARHLHPRGAGPLHPGLPRERCRGDAMDRLLAIGREALGDRSASRPACAPSGGRASSASPAGSSSTRRSAGAVAQPLAAEKSGRQRFERAGRRLLPDRRGPTASTACRRRPARHRRLQDRRAADGRDDQRAGFAPQLPLRAAMAQPARSRTCAPPTWPSWPTGGCRAGTRAARSAVRGRGRRRRTGRGIDRRAGPSLPDRRLRPHGDRPTCRLYRAGAALRFDDYRPPRARPGMGGRGRRRGMSDWPRVVPPSAPDDPGVPPAPRRRPDRRSVWVAASAGTGKTKVLTDRVLPLLLAGTPPAAHPVPDLHQGGGGRDGDPRPDRAGPGRWTRRRPRRARSPISPDLLGRPPRESDDSARARLFARVLDCPGGLKIQTIHAFCESLLGRFPLEAGLAPHFQVMDERDAREAAGRRPRRHAASVPVRRRRRALAQALDRIAGAHSGRRAFDELMAGARRRARPPARACSRARRRLAGAAAALRRRSSASAPTRRRGRCCRRRLRRRCVRPHGAARGAAQALRTGRKTDRQSARPPSRAWLAAMRRPRRRLRRLSRAFLTKNGGASRETLDHQGGCARPATRTLLAALLAERPSACSRSATRRRAMRTAPTPRSRC